jgi:hypothetical protein
MSTRVFQIIKMGAIKPKDVKMIAKNRLWSPMSKGGEP